MKKKIFFVIIFFCIICSVYLVRNTNSRYLSEIIMDSNINVAIPQIVIEMPNNIDSFQVLPGQNQEIEFSIKNYSDSKINEVLMNYYIDIDTKLTDLPLEYELYEVSGTNERKISEDSQGFGPIELAFGDREEKRYKLRVIWNENKNNISYVDQQYSFKIVVNTKEIYKQTQESEEIVFKGKGYSNLIAEIVDVSTLTGSENTFDITVTNPNEYVVEYKIMEENDLYNVEYIGTNNASVTIAADSTETIRVRISGKKDVIYENVLTDSSGEIYTKATVVLDVMNPYDAEQIEIGKNQIIYLERSIKDKIISQAGEIKVYEEGDVFSGPSLTTEASLCSITDPITGEIIYFYRGAVQNNYVSFAGYTWRILRINKDGSLRLILDDIITVSPYQNNNTPTENTISSALSLIDWKKSMVYSELQKWYSNNIATDYGEKVVESQFVFDNSYKELSSSHAGKCYYFGSYTRVGTDGNLFKPTFSCTEGIMIRDNVGLITADELAYAGAYFRTSNPSFFLCNDAIEGPCWTMSPSFWDASAHYKVGMVILKNDGMMHDWPSSGNTLTENLGIRPVISIRGDLSMSGNGTEINPYKYK